MSTLSVAVTIANIIVILTLLLRRRMISISTKYFLYVMNLAICDLIVGAFLIPVYIDVLLGKKVFKIFHTANVSNKVTYLFLVLNFKYTSLGFIYGGTRKFAYFLDGIRKNCIYFS